VAPFRSIHLFLDGDVSRRTLLAYVLPAASLSFFGSLALAISLRPGSHDWRSTTISKLALNPEYNPRFYWIALAGIALAGGFIFPFAGYIGRRLRPAAPWGSRVGETIFRIGAAGAVLVGMIGYHGNSLFPRLHTLMARGSAFALCAGVIIFWICTLWGRLGPNGGRPHGHLALVVCWSVLALSMPLAVILSVLETGHRLNRLAGLFEWGASATFFLFLLSSALLLSKQG
jgi:hypothetical protein